MAEQIDTIRVHVGHISESLAQNITDLEQRLGKYAEVVGGIELHKKDGQDTYFGYVTVNVSESQWKRMNSAVNGTVFKGTKLTLARARPDYRERYGFHASRQQSKNKVLLNADQLKRKYQEKPREEGVVYGRLRTVPRKDMRHMTFRVVKGDRVIKLRTNRTKLWGYAKDKKLDALVFTYDNGLWKDSHGDVVETARLEEAVTDAVATSADTGEERERNISILDSIFAGSKDPSRMELSDEEDGQVPDTVDDDDDMQVMIDNREGEATVVEFGDDEPAETPKPAFAFNWDEDEEDNDDNTEPANAESANTETGPRVNDTSTLRSLFNPADDSGGFRLFGGDDDEDEDVPDAAEKTADASADDVLAPILNPVAVEELPPAVLRGKMGLFFGHFDSPFLYSQTQAARMDPGTFDRTKWEESFWANRGDWNRELRKRRRDVTRQQRKRAMARTRPTAV